MKQAMAVLAIAAMMVAGSAMGAVTLQGETIGVRWNRHSGWSPGNVTAMGHGMAFDGPTTVEFISVGSQVGLPPEQGGDRDPYDKFWLYADGIRAGFICTDWSVWWWDDRSDIWYAPPCQVPILDPTTRDERNPITVTGTWFTLVPLRSAWVQMYPVYGYGDAYFGFHGTAYEGPKEINFNLNSPLNPIYRDVTCAGQLSSFSSQSANIVVNGKLTHGIGTSIDALVWDWLPGAEEPGSVTVFYNDPQDVGIVGIALFGGSDSVAPRWVEITDDKGETVRVFIDETLTFYNRYELPNGGFFGTQSLTITFPTPSDDRINDWYHSGGYYGLTEFQAFGPKIPEPMAMSLLVLGGAALLRRR